MVFATNLSILLNLPVLRQVLGFPFLTILPGLLILRSLKINKLNTIETILYSIGLSIAFVMLTGFSMNVSYPLLGFSKPISILPLVVTISAAVLILAVINYWVNRDFFSTISVDTKNIKELFSPVVLLLILLPVMSILGMCMFTFYGNNLVLLFLIILISIVVILTGFNIISIKYHSIVIFTIALALVLYGSLITFYIVGAGRDFAIEFYYYDLVMSNSYWDPTHYNNVNAMLSITILPVIFSKILNISGEWVFRIVYPLILAFVPLALYQAYQRQTSANIAFLSVFFFMAMPTFFNMIPILARMCIAELFFALLLLLIMQENIDGTKRVALLIIFAFSLATSHYGLSYFYIFYIFSFIFISFVISDRHVGDFFESLQNKIEKYVPIADEPVKSKESNDRTLTKTFVLTYTVFAISWYMHMSSSSAFNSIVRIADHVHGSLFTDFLNPLAREGSVLIALGMGLETGSLWHVINRYVWHVTELFVIVGLLGIIIKHRELKFQYEYIILSFIGSILLAMCITLPYFSCNFSMKRIYHVALFFLAPCCVIGGQIIFKLLSKFLKRLHNPLGNVENSSFALTSFLLIILIPYFLFTSGFVFTVTDDLPAFTPLSAEKYKLSDNINLKVTYIYFCIPKEDFVSAKWLSEYKNNRSVIYTGFTSKKYLLTPYPLPPTERIRILDRPNQGMESGAFIYLRHLNIETGKIITSRTTEQGMPYFNYSYFNITNFSQLSENNKIYSNNGSEIYKQL